jgi:amino acid permease
MTAFRRTLNLGADATPGPKERSYSIHEETVLSPDSGPVAANNTGLHRGLKARQISMIALGGAIGSERTLNYFYR